MSKLSDALGSMQSPGLSRIRGGVGGAFNFQQANQGEDPSYASKSKLIGTIGKMAEIGAEAYTQIDAKNKTRADERSNEIIAKLSPEQRREAIQNGTLLYQDDPYAMKALREKTGRNAAFLVDDDVNQKVQAGEFRTRMQMEQYRHDQMQKQRKDFADTFGISDTDEDFQRGFNSNITERNIQLYGQHDNFLSEQAKKGNVLNSRIELQGALQDPNVLRSPQSGEFMEKYIAKGLTDNTIPSDEQAMQIISSSFNDVVQRDGGANFLAQMENRKVKLYGVEQTYKQMMGDDQWNSLMVKAQHTQFTNDAKRMEKFSLDMNSAVLQEDSSKGWEMLQGMKADLDRIQPGEQMTPERQQLIEAQATLQQRFKTEAAATAKLMDTQKKVTNKNAVIEQQFAKRLNGEYVSTDYKDMPTNANTGEFTYSDMVNHANKKLSDIDNMDIPEGAKDREKLRYLRADSKDGAFRAAVGTMITDAQGEWQAGVLNGKLPESTPAMDKLRRLRNADPDLVGALYPQQADMFQTLDMMDKYGVDPQVMIDADKSRSSRSKEQDYEDSKAFESMLNDSRAAEVSRVPGPLRDMARKVFDSWKYRTGNADAAAQQVQKFLVDSTTTFKSGDADGGTYGVISRQALQVGDDPRTWEQGRDIIESAVKAHIAQNPWVTNKQMSVYEQGDSIFIQDTSGSFRVRYDKKLLQAEYQQTQSRAAEAARKEAIEKANRRAPIAEVNKVSKEIKEGKRKGLAQRSQEFREMRLNRKQ